LLPRWTTIDIGHEDGSGSLDGKHNGYYLQFFDPTLNGPRINDANFTMLDYAISRCAQLGMRAVLSLVNNWRGMHTILFHLSRSLCVCVPLCLSLPLSASPEQNKNLRHSAFP
jgi:hypothetical protein